MSRTHTALVADIGGTNARFALARCAPGEAPALEQIRQFTVAAHASPIDAAATYLKMVAEPAPERAVFAVACALHGDRIRFTNSPWTLSVTEAQTELALAELKLVNDFSALSRAIPLLGQDTLEPIGSTQPRTTPQGDDRRTYAAIGAGTGLGTGGLLVANGRVTVLESEGGHATFAPADAYERDILDQLWAQFPRVSNERLISGHGLVNLYRAICRIENTDAQHEAPDAIVATARDGERICEQTVLRFCAMLGSVAGDLALTLGAWDGVYLGGGVTERLSYWLPQSDFRRRFEDKGRHAALMRTVPTVRICHPAVGLLGAAAFADERWTG